MTHGAKKMKPLSLAERRLMELLGIVRWAYAENQTERSEAALEEIERALTNVLRRLKLWERPEWTEWDWAGLFRKVERRSERRRGL